MTTRRGYCSWCFEDAQHRPQETNSFRRHVYRCGSCGERTLICRVPSCDHMTRGAQKWDDEFCAAHGGEIASFRRLSVRLEHLEEYEQLFRPEVANFRKITTVVAIFLGGTVCFVPLAFAAAYAVGGALGTAFGLSGAAASAKGLAMLGLGSVAAGGFGMAGGAAVVTAVGAATGGVLSGVIANAYFGDIQGFRIKKLRDGVGAGVIVVNGFLTQSKAQDREWQSALCMHYPHNPWYLVEWESKRLVDIGTLALSTGGQEALKRMTTVAAKKAAKATAKRANPLVTVLTAMDLAKNPWHVAMVKAAPTGVLLADILARTPDSQQFILLGHSLGARVIYYALQSLVGKMPQKICQVHLLGGAVGKEPGDDWRKVASTIAGKLHNYHSANDDVLRILYAAGTFFLGSPPIGRHPIEVTEANIENHDVSRFVQGHGAFKVAAADFLQGTKPEAEDRDDNDTVPQHASLWATMRTRVRKVWTQKPKKSALWVKPASAFRTVWTDRGSGGHLDGAFYKPMTANGYHLLGYYGLQGHTELTGWRESRGVLAVKADPALDFALKPPLDYLLIWDDRGTGAKSDAAFWRPLPPEGYVALGVVVSQEYKKPSTDEIRCVHQSFVTPGKATKLVWNDQGTGGASNISCWLVEPRDESGLSCGTFYAHASYEKPPQADLYCLKGALCGLPERPKSGKG